MKFAKVTLQCLGCKTPLPAGSSSVCKSCVEKVRGPRVCARPPCATQAPRLTTPTRTLVAAPPRAAQEPEIFAQKLTDVNACEQAFNRLWTQCQRCQGDLHKDVLCTSRDCPIYYRRKKIQKDLTDAHDVVLRFGAPAW